MHAQFLKKKSDHRSVMWEVRDGSRWWTVVFHTRDGSYSIMNESLRDVNPDGALGRKLIAATKA